MRKEEEKIEGYIEEICSYIKNKDVHEEISSEIREHIYDIVDENINEDISNEQAVENAILRLGTARECGIELNKVHKAKPDIISIVSASILVFIGIITMYSLKKNYADEISLSKNMAGIGIGGIIAGILYFFDYRKLKKYSYFIYSGSLALFILSRIIESENMVSYNQFCDERVYFHLFIVVLLLFSMCGIIDMKKVSDLKSLSIVGVIGAFPLYILLNSSDFISSFIFLCGMNIIFINSKVEKKLKVYLILIEILSIIACVLKFYDSYIGHRVYAIINPSNNFQYDSIIKAKNMFFNSKILGVNSEVDIPNIHVSFVISYIMNKFGIIVGSLCISTCIILIIRMFKIRSKVKDVYGRSILLMIMIVFLIEISINILVNIGIVGTFIGLPFICYGFFNEVTNILMIGIVCSIYRRRLCENFKCEAIN